MLILPPSSPDIDIACDVLNVDGGLVGDGLGLMVGREVRVVLVRYPAMMAIPGAVWLDRMWGSKHNRTWEKVKETKLQNFLAENISGDFLNFCRRYQNTKVDKFLQLLIEPKTNNTPSTFVSMLTCGLGLSAGCVIGKL